MTGLNQPPYMHMNPVHWHAACQEVAVLIAEDVADLRRDRRIVAEKAKLVPDLVTHSIMRRGSVQAQMCQNESHIVLCVRGIALMQPAVCRECTSMTRSTPGCRRLRSTICSSSGVNGCFGAASPTAGSFGDGRASFCWNRMCRPACRAGILAERLLWWVASLPLVSGGAGWC